MHPTLIGQTGLNQVVSSISLHVMLEARYID
jgi:hypothetical protein